MSSSFVYEVIAVALSLRVFLLFIRRVGQYVALLDCIVFIAALEVILVPAITYWLVPASMPVESNDYFGYALPAWLAFYAGIFLFSSPSSTTEQARYGPRICAYVRQKPLVSVALLLVGTTGFLVKLSFPTAPSFVSTLPMYCLLVSTLYALYAHHPHRRLITGIVLVVLMTNTVRTGMFGDLFSWGLMGLIFSSASRVKPITTRAKVLSVGLGFTFLLLIQSIKAEYRYNTWGYQRHERTTNPQLMITLIADRLTHPDKLVNVTHLFMAFVRFNQGIMIGSAMAKVPLHEPYAQGEVLLSFLYPFVPRLLWPGKPQTGGYENIRRFTSLPQFENTSINLSPLGEGYVNFGYGGIVFAFVYGVLLGGIFQLTFRLATRVPSLVLWLPMLYMGCLTMETDVLSAWGSMANSALVVALLYIVSKRVGIQL